MGILIFFCKTYANPRNLGEAVTSSWTLHYKELYTYGILYCNSLLFDLCRAAEPKRCLNCEILRLLKRKKVLLNLSEVQKSTKDSQHGRGALIGRVGLDVGQLLTRS